jgi:REP element-mobilizing transposase RayT
MGKPKQLAFFEKRQRFFGGCILRSHPKEARPLSTKEALHVVLKSEWAIGPTSLLNHSDFVDKLIRHWAKKCGVEIYQLVNVGNHLHLVVRLTKLTLYPKFIRTITALIARHVGQKHRGPVRSSKTDTAEQESHFQFWLARPYTRIVAWGKDWENILKYMRKNRQDAQRLPIDSWINVQIPGFDFETLSNTA